MWGTWTKNNEHLFCHTQICYQHTRRMRSILVYFILKQKSVLKVRDVRGNWGAECGSEHRLVAAKIYIPSIGMATRN